MTLPISSHKNGIGHTLLVTLKQFFMVPIICIVYFVLLIDSPIIISYLTQRIGSSSSFTGKNYCLIQNGSGIFLVASICILSAACAVILFRFLYSERAVNTYLAVGVSRMKLFCVRYLFGLVSILGAIVLTLTVSMLLNLSLFPSPYLMDGYGYLLFGMCVQAFTVYSITALICILSGTLVEGLFHSVVILLAPSMIFSAAESVLTLMFGSYYMRPFYSYYPTSSLISTMENYNPLLLISSQIDNFGSPYLTMDDKLSDLVTANYGALLAWCMIAVLLFFVAMFAFIQRKAEISGKAGTNKLLGSISSGIIAFYVASLPFYEYSLATPIKLLIALGLFVITFFLCTLFVNRGIKKLGGYLKGGSVILAGCVILVGISLTGGLGYSGYVPNADMVKTANITYKGSPIISNISGYYSYWLNDSTQQFTTEDKTEIELVTKLHQEIVDAGQKEFDGTVYTPFDKTVVSSEVAVNYEMKDGTVVNRYYPCLDLKTLAEMLSLEDTETIREQIPANIKEMANHYPNIQIVLADSLYRNREILDLDNDAYLQLTDALSRDLQNESIEDRYYPEKDCLAVLSFTPLFDEYYQADPSILPGVDVSYVYYISETYTNTIDFLTSHGLLPLKATEKPEVESIELIRYTPFPITNYTGYLSNHPYFQLINYPEDMAETYFDELESTKVDPSKYQQVLDAARCNYYTDQGGYVAKIKFQNSNEYLYKFIPEQSARGLL